MRRILGPGTDPRVGIGLQRLAHGIGHARPVQAGPGTQLRLAMIPEGQDHGPRDGRPGPGVVDELLVPLEVESQAGPFDSPDGKWPGPAPLVRAAHQTPSHKRPARVGVLDADRPRASLRIDARVPRQVVPGGLRAPAQDCVDDLGREFTITDVVVHATSPMTWPRSDRTRSTARCGSATEAVSPGRSWP